MDLSRSDSGRHVTVQGTAPPSNRRAPVECTECSTAGKDCDVFEGDGHGRCRFCSHHRACHKDIHSVCTECRSLGKHCQHFEGTGAQCDTCSHSKALHGIETAIGGRREPVQCTECELTGRKCDVFQGDGTKHCIFCAHHDVCHKDNQVEMKGKRILVDCTECRLVGKSCTVYQDYKDRVCQHCNHHDVCHQVVSRTVPAGGVNALEARLNADLASIRRGL